MRVPHPKIKELWQAVIYIIPLLCDVKIVWGMGGHYNYTTAPSTKLLNVYDSSEFHDFGAILMLSQVRQRMYLSLQFTLNNK